MATLCFCCGCQQKASPGTGLEYTETYLRLAEPCGTELLFSGRAPTTAVGGHTYQFQPEVSPEDRAAFIDAQEELCTLLERRGLETEVLVFRILEHGAGWSDSEKRIAYLDLGCIQSWMQALITAQSALGDYTNYGFLYALADRAAETLHWERESQESVSVEVFEADSALLQLVYPCFDGTYTAPAEIAACKALAVQLFGPAGGIWSEAAFLSALKSWAAANSISFSPTRLGFAYNSESCPLKVRTEYLEILREKDFTGDSMSGTLSEHFPKRMENTSALIRSFEWLDRQLGTLRERFGAGDSRTVRVILSDQLPISRLSSGEPLGGYYDAGHLQIYACTLDTLVHEYTHHLAWLLGEDLSQKQDDRWCSEVLACYYGDIGRGFEYHMLRSKYAESGHLAQIEALLGKAYEEPADFIRFMRAAYRCADGINYIGLLQGAYEMRPFFGEYFVRTYGETCFQTCMVFPAQIRALTGKTLDEIVDDWVADMKDAAMDSLVVCPVSLDTGE